MVKPSRLTRLRSISSEWGRNHYGNKLQLRTRRDTVQRLIWLQHFPNRTMKSEPCGIVRWVYTCACQVCDLGNGSCCQSKAHILYACAKSN